MRLSLSFPRGWRLSDGPDSRLLAVLPGSGSTPEVAITYGPIVMCPDQVDTWIDDTLRVDTPAGSRVNVGAAADRKTAAGWDVRLVEAEVVSDSGEVVDARLCAFYKLMEHAAAATVHASSRAKLDEHRGGLMEILRSGRPDWRGEPICLAELWDLDPPRPPSAAAQDSNVEAHLARGQILEQRGRPAEALAELEQAVARAPGSARAHYLIGVAHDALGRRDEAIAAWEQALVLEPGHADACYRLARAHFQLGRAEQALAEFQRCGVLAAGNVLAAREVVRTLHALGRYEEGEVARATMRALCLASPDPRARLLDEYCFDEYARDGGRVEVFETLRPRDPRRITMLTFRAVDAERRPLAAVRIDTGEEVRRTGKQFAIGVVVDGGQLRVLGTTQRLPPYRELRQTADGMLSEALRKS